MAENEQKERSSSDSAPWPTTKPRHMKSIFFVLVILRLINALTIRTFFQPDEYFQSLEPAIFSAFGSSANPWITWEWHHGLRSSLHPLVFGSVYKAAEAIVSNLDLDSRSQADALIAAPKVLQALFAAFTDAYTYRFACDVYGSGAPAAWGALFLTALSPWMWFASTRTFSNSVETTLTIIALRLWPWDLFLGPSSKQPRHPDPPTTRLYGALCAAAVACILRPTNIIIWATISIHLVLRSRDINAASKLASAAVICGSGIMTLSIAADRAYYGDFVFPPLRFLQFNVIQSLAAFYGQNRPDYYLTEGLPLLLTTALPFAAISIWQTLRPSPAHIDFSSQISQGIRFTLVVAIIIPVAVLSLISHKEVRFIFPLLPMLHILAAKPIATFFRPASRSPARILLLVLALAVNLVIIYYTAFVHQRGVIDVMHYLRHENEARFDLEADRYSPISVGFFMPCHSTPWRSHFIYPDIAAWALTCEPPLHLTLTERETYLDEADVFYKDPVAWVRENMKSVHAPDREANDDSSEVHRRKWPQYVVFFEQLEPFMKELLQNTRYHECWRGFNTHWHDDRRREGDVIVWCSSRSRG